MFAYAVKMKSAKNVDPETCRLLRKECRDGTWYDPDAGDKIVRVEIKEVRK